MYTIILVIHTILVLFLIGMVLIQRSESDGFGLGGGGMSNFMTGRSAANAMTKTTAILAALFMGTSLLLASMTSHMANHSIVEKVMEQQQAPAKEESAPVAPVPDKTAPDNTVLEKTAPEKEKGDAAKPVGKAKTAPEKTPAKAAEPRAEEPEPAEEAPKPAGRKAPSVPRPE